MNPETLNEYRLFHLAAQSIVPLIEKLHQDAFERLMLQFREGHTDLISSVAKVEALHSLLEEIKIKSKTYEHHLSKGVSHES